MKTFTLSNYFNIPIKIINCSYSSDNNKNVSFFN